MLTGIAFLIGSALLGIGLVRRLPPLRRLLNHPEQAMWGMVVGWMLATFGAYLVARGFGRLSFRPMLGFAVAVWIIAVALWLRPMRDIWREGLRERKLWRQEYVGCVLVLALFAPIFLSLFTTRMLQPAADGIYSGGNSWYDMALHASITTSFVYGENFPPLATAFPPEPLRYPFLPDFLTAVLMRLGMDLHSALVATAAPLALSLTGIFYWFAHRLTKIYLGVTLKPVRVQAAAVLATLLFLFNGGLGFLYFFSDWWASGQPLTSFWSQATVSYANMGDRSIHWTNIIVDTLLPQRASLFGLPLAMMIFMIFVVVWESNAGGKVERAWEGGSLLLIAGVLTGLLPLFHTHSYMAVGLVSGLLFLLRPRRVWIVFWLPAVLLAAPTLVGLAGHASTGGILRWQPGWRGHDQAFWPIYWIRNVGLPTVLILPAWFVAPAKWRRFYLAFVLLLILGLTVVVSPNDYDNIKLMFYWYAVTAVFVAAWLVKLASLRRLRVLALALATVLALVSIASGILSVRAEYLSRKLFLSAEEVGAAEFVKNNSAPHALFLTAAHFNQPVWTLAGRPILRGEYLWHHAYPYQEREADVKSIYVGSPDAIELLKYYRVEYIYLGPGELDELSANRAFFDERFPVFYRSQNITIYDARAVTGADPNADVAAAYPPREFASRVGKDPAQLLVEFPRASYAVYRLHRVSYGGMPKYQEFIEDFRRLGAGVYVSASGWQRILEDNKTRLTDEWVTRANFKALYDGKSNEQYIDALYANAGVAPTAGERNSLISALNGGSETRAGVLRRVAENRELYRNDYNRAFMLVHFFGYLRRNPDDPPDNNLVGFNFWLGELNRTGDHRSVSRVFIESGEYKDQVKQKK